MVNIHGNNLTDQVFQNLSHLTALRTIYLDSPKLQGDGLDELKHLRNLTTLSIGVFSNKGKSKLNPDYAQNLKYLTQLEGLELPNNTKLNDNTLKHIGVLRKLKVLKLSQSKITDAGLVHLKRLTNLEELWLNDTKITDAGLVHLKGMTSLNALGLYNTKITDAGVADLQKALPNCEIQH